MVRKIKNKQITKEAIEVKKKIERLKKQSSVKECLWKDIEECEGKIIQAHSIQNNRFLDKISKDGSVLTFSIDMENGKSTLEKKGRKTFSTFKGFCQKHDMEIFRPIEYVEYQSTKEQKFLFAFRALSKDYHVKKETENLYNTLIEEFPFNPLVLMQKTNIQKSLEGHRKDFEKMSVKIKNKNYNDLKTKEIILDKEYPIVTNSAFIPYLNSKNKNIFSKNNYGEIQEGILEPTIFLNIFPQDGKTFILISYFEIYETLLLPFLNDFENNLEEQISMMIIRNCENVGFNPDYIKNNFTEKEIENILENFSRNLNHSHVPLNLNLNLFR